MDFSIPAILADPGPPGTASAHVLNLWAKVQERMEAYNHVTSHSKEGVSYATSVQAAERQLQQYYEAYKRALALSDAVEGTNPLLLQKARGWGVDYSGMELHRVI